MRAKKIDFLSLVVTLIIMLQASKTKISTGTFIGNLNTTFDLKCIFKYLSISPVILGIKYDNEVKGDIKNNKSFFNQMTLKININEYEKISNLKIFKNGAFQITGVKDSLQAKATITKFLDIVVTIQGHIDVEVIIENGVVYDKEDYLNLNQNNSDCVRIYGYDDINDSHFYCIGTYNGCVFTFGDTKVEFLPLPGLQQIFFDKQHCNKIKQMYSTNGNPVGEIEYFFTHKRKNLILHGYRYKSASDTRIDIYDKKDKCIGHIEIRFSGNILTYTCVQETITVRYSGINNKPKNFEVIPVNLNCNFQIDLGGKLLDRHQINEIFVSKYSLQSYFNPNFYHAVNLKIYCDSINCIVHSNKTTDSQIKITALIFQSGKVMLSGCKSKSQIISIKKYILNLLSKDNSFFIESDSSVDFGEIFDPNITIWDIL
jgi:TATA-box binding protein (TBP) (component of TFIID and TFIIIB)